MTDQRSTQPLLPPLNAPAHLGPLSPEQVTGHEAWPDVRAAVRGAISGYVRALHPRPGIFSALWNDRAEHRARYLLTLATERALVDHLELRTIAAGQWAMHYGATPAELAAIDGTTAEVAAERYAIPADYRGQRFLPQRPDWTTPDAHLKPEVAASDDPTGRS